MSLTTRSDPYILIIRALSSARKNKRLRQVDLAARLHKPQSFVSKFETGERRLDVVEFIVIANAIGISAPDWIADLEHLIGSKFPV